MNLLIQTDGASRGNPGPASYGFVIFADGIVLYEEGKTLGETTNNVAEYTALFQALAYLKTSVDLSSVSELVIQADSQLLIRQLSGMYKIRNERLFSIFKQINELLEVYPKVRFEHIRRELNKRADALANFALDSAL